MHYIRVTFLNLYRLLSAIYKFDTLVELNLKRNTSDMLIKPKLPNNHAQSLSKMVPTEIDNEISSMNSE